MPRCNRSCRPGWSGKNKGQLARRMSSLDVGALPVCAGRRLSGMITHRDITVRATAVGRDSKTTLVSDCLSSELTYCFEDQDARSPSFNGQKQIRRLLVLNRDKQLVGIVAVAESRHKRERNRGWPDDSVDFLTEITRRRREFGIPQTRCRCSHRWCPR